MLYWVKTLILSALVSVSLTQILDAQSPNDIVKMRVMTVERKPFAFQQDGIWIGFAIELWKAVAGLYDIETEFVGSDTFSEMLNAVEDGFVDAAVANISITHSREQRMDFSQPIFDAGLIVLMPKTNSPSIFSIILSALLLSN